jgi:protein-S-isoprenylcysteine O-methyltransferase Ste14
MRDYFHTAVLLIGAGLAGAAPLADLYRLTKPPVDAEAWWLPGTGFMLAVLGMAVTIASQYQMGASWRVGVDEGEITFSHDWVV